MDRGERGSAGRRLYHERSKEVNLFQIYNMDSGNAMELGFHADPNESSFPRRMKDNSELALSTNKEAISNATMNLVESSILAQDERWRHA
ncbi:hypothetical protein PVK06_027858 [Gossypium arboreum]|uniref:Uncharacterized protein n=1 Tax=Gossypium arboreum TaxID=29729 RepID=A0ABR0P1D9_GOSAR|nr:hypothetical protein PVK06_027858 [Gossypium arboreum]